MNATDRTTRKRSENARIVRMHIVVRGAVQGIGFRPFVYRLARELELGGSVSNSPYGVVIDVEGPTARVDVFQRRLVDDRPPLSQIDRVDAIELAPSSMHSFEIADSESDGETTAFVVPDIAVCAECLRELRDPSNRRYRYPFINCTHCGPRYSIVHALPYDRPNTTMRAFRMCAHCRDEYENPADRRFHAQPIACPVCGPALSVWGAGGDVYASNHDALLMAATEIRAGRIVALKGLGGFQLLADARDSHAIGTLRERKHRAEKPFAVMYPDMDMVRADCQVSPLEGALLSSPESPIVLLKRTERRAHITGKVAPGVATVGVMLPYTPLHHLLMDELGFPIVATSGNLSDEPICIDEREALRRLGDIADFFLVHDRPIVRQVDDSIVRVIAGREMVLRRARGYAPLPIDCGVESPPVLAVGSHLKNTVAMSKGRHIFVSQHIGDLETLPAYDAFARETSAIQQLLDAKPVAVACDYHPDYASSRRAREFGLPVVEVQHHYAHVLACMAEHELDGPVLGVSWDGTGLGTDGTIWGGEFLLADRDEFTRVAHLREFRLPGGDRAAREPRRSALSVLSHLDVDFDELESIPALQSFTEYERLTLSSMLQKEINAPTTTSVGRLFDAVASIAGVCHRSTYEGQAAMLLEGLASIAPSGATPYEFDITDREGVLIIDWIPVIRALVADVKAGDSPGLVASRFHGALANAVLAIARGIGIANVVLTGGCFQNAVLTEQTIDLLCGSGFRACWHRFVPPNDGGIALGQAVYAMRHVEGPRRCV